MAEISPNRLRIFFMPQDNKGCGFYRMMVPANEIKRQNLADIVVNFGWNWKMAEQADLIIIQRQSDTAAFEAIDQAHSLGKKIIYEIDDYLQGISPHNPAYDFWSPMGPHLGRALKLMQKVDAMQVSTPRLRNEYSLWNPVIEVMPNYLDKNLWDNPRWTATHWDNYYKKKNDDIIRIGWCFPLDTEILTNNGWKDYHSFDNELDKVATYKDGLIDYEKSQEVIFNKSQKVIHYKNSTQDIAYTEDHLSYYVDQNSKKGKYEKFGELVARKPANVVFKTAGILNNFGITRYPVEFYESICHIVSDGFFTKHKGIVDGIGYDVKSIKKHNLFKNLLNNLNIKYSVTKDSTRGHKRIRIHKESFNKLYRDWFDGKKELKQYMAILPRSTRVAILDAYCEADGSFDKRNKDYLTIRSTNKKNIDILQQIATTLGFRNKYVINKCGKSNNNLYRLTIIKTTDETFADFRDKSKISESIEDTWDVYVGGKNIICRRNGTINITHNCGAGSHYHDLQLIEQVITKICQKYHNVHFCMMGYFGESNIGKNLFQDISSNTSICSHCKGAGQLEKIPGIDLLYYPSKLKECAFDIAVAPLIETGFNQGKSDLKIKEYAALGIPVIASRMTPYKESVKDGYTGLLATTGKEWYDNIELLIKNEELRKQLGKNNLQWHKENTIDRHIGEWLQFYNRVVSFHQKW